MYYFLKVKSLLPRCNIEYSLESARKVLENELGSISTSEGVFYAAAVASELSDANILQSICALNSLYLQNDGTSRRVASDPDSNTYLDSAYILEAVELCLLKGSIDQSVALKLIDQPLESILLNSIAIEPYQICILEGTETLELTTKIFRLFNVLPIESLKSASVFN